MSELTRRRVVAAAGALGTAAVAGCLGSADDGDGSSNESDGARGMTAETSLEGGTVLGEIGVENLDDEAHTIDVLVEYDDEIEHWSTHEIEAGTEGASLEGEWPEDPGEFRVTARLDGDDFEQVTPEKWNEPACLNLLVLVGRDGRIRTTGDTDGGACDALELDEEPSEDGEDDGE